MRNLTATISVTFLFLALAGCAATPAPVTSTEPTVEPAPVISPTEEPAPERADYGFRYFGLANLGDDWAAMSAQLERTVSGLPECPYYGEVGSTGTTTTYAYIDERDETAGVEIFYTLEGSTTSADPAPRNVEGVGIGSTHDQVLAAFPTAVVGSMTDLGAGEIGTITVSDPDSDSQYVYGFSDASATVNLLQWGPYAGGQWSHLCGGL